MSDSTFESIDVQRAVQTLASLHDQVVSGKTRIELRGQGAESVSVIISKVELESLENALAILSNTSDVRTVCQILQRLATTSMAADLAPIPRFELPESVVECNT